MHAGPCTCVNSVASCAAEEEDIQKGWCLSKAGRLQRVLLSVPSAAREDGHGRCFMDVEAGQESRRNAWERCLCECQTWLRVGPPSGFCCFLRGAGRM